MSQHNANIGVVIVRETIVITRRETNMKAVGMVITTMGDLLLTEVLEDTNSKPVVNVMT